MQDLFSLGSVFSFVAVLLGIGGVLSTFAFVSTFISRSRKNGMIQSDIERLKQLADENKYLTNKNNYLEMKFRKVDEVLVDLQRQINSLSAHISELSSPKATTPPPPPPQPQLSGDHPTPTVANLPSSIDRQIVTPPPTAQYVDQPRRPLKGNIIGLNAGVDY